jgi:regulator of replication initiation timing
MRIYNADTALQAEDAAFISTKFATDKMLTTSESSISHFCAFVDFYTRKSADPVNTALVCEEQAEAIRLEPQDLTQENVQLLLDTMLNAIDHLGKKWLDEQIQHDARKQEHRQDVARLYQQLAAQQREPQKHSQHLYQKGLHWLRQHLVQNSALKSKRSLRKKHMSQKEATAY